MVGWVCYPGPLRPNMIWVSTGTAVGTASRGSGTSSYSSSVCIYSSSAGISSCSLSSAAN
jgi:hypothetical protein